MTVIGLVGEDENHFQVAAALIDDALVNSIDWVQDILESCREWRGLHGGRDLDGYPGRRDGIDQACRQLPWLNWARAFLDEVDRHVLPVFGHRPDA